MSTGKTCALWGFRPGNGTAPYPLMTGTAAKCRAELNRRAKAGWICEIAPGAPGALAPSAITSRYLGLTSRHDDELGFTVTRYGDRARYAEHRDAGGFAWTCRTPRPKGGDSWDRAEVAEVCEITSGDRDWYEQHAARHGRPAPELYDLDAARKPWAPPSRREYQPAAMAAGQPVTWTVPARSYYEQGGYVDAGGIYHAPSGRVEVPEQTRAGTIWSAGPKGPTWWVTPDGDPAGAVVIRRMGDGQLVQEEWWADWRDEIRRAENVRKRGIYPVVHETYQSGGYWAHERTTGRIIRWHADPGCPDAAGKDREVPAGDRDWTVHKAVDVLTSRVSTGGLPPFCKRCIMLEPQPEETPSEAVPAGASC